MLFSSERQEEKYMRKSAHLGIKIDPDLHDRLKYIAKYEGRSMSGQILYLITTNVREFEKKHGEITAEELEKVK